LGPGVERSKIQKGKVYGGTLPFLMHAPIMKAVQKQFL
jgi:hypothetical protein